MVVRPCEGELMAGAVTLVRMIWRQSAPQLSMVPPLGCQDTLKNMLFIDGEGAVANESIPELRAALEAATVAAADFPGAVVAITGILAAFNAQHGTSYAVDSNCSLPGHISTGAGGCRPGTGHSLLLNNGVPPTPKLSANFVAGSLTVSHGLVVSIKYPDP
jgi:hypothetical protein